MLLLGSIVYCAVKTHSLSVLLSDPQCTSTRFGLYSVVCAPTLGTLQVAEDDSKGPRRQVVELSCGTKEHPLAGKVVYRIRG